MAVPHPAAAAAISGGEKGLVAVILVVAVLALGFAVVLVRQVLAADQGTPEMQEIAQGRAGGRRAPT